MSRSAHTTKPWQSQYRCVMDKRQETNSINHTVFDNMLYLPHVKTYTDYIECYQLANIANCSSLAHPQTPQSPPSPVRTQYWPCWRSNTKNHVPVQLERQLISHRSRWPFQCWPVQRWLVCFVCKMQVSTIFDILYWTNFRHGNFQTFVTVTAWTLVSWYYFGWLNIYYTIWYPD